MALIHNGEQLEISKDILMDKWIPSVTGDTEPEKPNLCVFQNSSLALEMLNKHIKRNSKIVFHTDVDVDGIGTTYIIKKTLNSLGSTNHILLINKDKEHGIMKKHVEYFKTRKVDLIIITDSSCNEIETIKSFNCDVLVIDHHELLNKELSGVCNDGEHQFVIVNNTIANSNQERDNLWLRNINNKAFENLEDYKGNSDMSCGLVVYELLRLYCICFSDKNLLENLMLYQWVGVTLFTDVIDTLNDRNQWYLNKTVFNNDTEASLKLMLNQLNKFKVSLDKSFIQYTFAPLINKAIRAGEGAEALNIIINDPVRIGELHKYDIMQQEAIEKATTCKHTDVLTGAETRYKIVFNEPIITLNLDKLDIKPSYSGVIASRLSGDNNKNVLVYIVTPEGLYKGSFRGRYKNVDYRKYFEEYDSSVYAQGHPNAFGFKVTPEQLKGLINGIESIEPKTEMKPFLTLGDFSENERGVYHINSLDEFKKQGYLWRIATGNSKVTSRDEIVIRVKASDVVLEKVQGKVYIYNVFGLQCKAFSAISGEYFDIYMEHTNMLNFYIR